MPHVYDLDSTQMAELVTAGLARIKPRIRMTAQMYAVLSDNGDGTFSFAGSYTEQELDLTCGLLNKFVVLRLSIPVLPTANGKAVQGANVRLKFANTDRYLSAVDVDGFLDWNTIQDSEIVIEAEAGSMNPLPFYKGRIIKQPTEREGEIELDLRDVIWEMLDVEVRHEEKGSQGNMTPKLFHNNPGTNTFTVQPYTIAGPSGSMEFHHGIAVFNSYGIPKTSLENSKPSDVVLHRIDLQYNSTEGTSPRLGLYKITFVDQTNFVVDMPDGARYNGNINQLFLQQYIQIDPSYWTTGADPTGAEITWRIFYTVKGNPVTIAKNLIEKAFSEDWGNAPTYASTFPVDWSRFNELEQYFQSWTVYVSETNPDNQVFSSNTDAKPLRVKDLVQKILDHIGCQLTLDGSGRVSVNSSWYLLPGETVHVVESCHLSRGGSSRKSAHEVFAAGPKYDKIILQYGLNPITGNYSVRTVKVKDPSKAKYYVYELSLDYFKANVNTSQVNCFLSRMFDLAELSQTRVRLWFLPNWGLPLMPGDKLQLDFDCPPILQSRFEYVQIYQVQKRLGDVVQVEAAVIPAPAEPARYCVARYCDTPSGCMMVSIAPGTISAVDPVTNTYTLDLTVSYSGEPATGDLEVNGQTFAITGSPQNLTLTNLWADGQPLTVTAKFTDDTLCAKSIPQLITAPDGFQPEDLTSALLIFDAAENLTLLNGNRVVVWNDITNNFPTWNMWQINAAKMPTLSTSDSRINNQPVVLFDESNQQNLVYQGLNVPPWTGNDYTVVLFGIAVGDGLQNGTFVAFGGSTVNSGTTYGLINFDGARIWHRDAATLTTTIASALPGGIAANDPVMVIARVTDGGLMKLKFNNEAEATATAVQPAGVFFDNFAFGSMYYNNTQIYGESALAYVGVFDGLLADSEVNSIITYFNNRFGTSFLPV